MDDIVWSINPDNDTLENLLERFRRFASALLEAKEIHYNVNIEANVRNVKLVMEERQHIYMILKEAINNLVKYSCCTLAEISVMYQHKHLEITVRDNGIGFDQGRVRSGNGLINIKYRADKMNASLQIISNPGAGTSVLLKLKIK